MNRWWRRFRGLGRRTRTGAVLVGATSVLLGAAAVLLSAADGGGSRASSTVVWEPGPAGATAPVSPDVDRAGRADGGAPGTESAQSAPAAGLAVPPPPRPDPAAPVGGVPVGGVQRSLVRTAQVAVEVGDPVLAGRRVRAITAAAGGYVTEERVTEERVTEERVTEERLAAPGAWVVLRVPAGTLDQVVDQVAGLGRVLERSGRTVDATEDVVDLDARVASQQAGIVRLRALLARAESIGDVVAVESELARREAELDSLTARLTALRDQVAFSTLTVELRVAAPPDGDDPETFVAGLGAGWDGLRAFGSAVAVAAGFVLPYLLVLALLAGAARLAHRRVRLRRP